MRTEPKASYRMFQYKYVYRYTPKNNRSQCFTSPFMLKIPCEKSNVCSEKTHRNIDDIILNTVCSFIIFVQSNPLLNVKFSYYHQPQTSKPSNHGFDVN